MITCKNNLGEPVTLPKEKFVFRPGVYGLIRREGKLCVCRTKSKGKLWFPGGGIDIGERRIEALLREIEEETGLKNVQVGKLVGSLENFFYYAPLDVAMHSFLFFYECTANDANLKLNEEVEDGEATDFAWVDVDRLRPEDFNDLNEEVFALAKGV